MRVQRTYARVVDSGISAIKELRFLVIIYIYICGWQSDLVLGCSGGGGRTGSMTMYGVEERLSTYVRPKYCTVLSLGLLGDGY